MHRTGGRLDLGIGRIELAIADVIAHIAGEDERILQHHTHLTAQRLQRHITHVIAVNRNRTFRNIIEA